MATFQWNSKYAALFIILIIVASFFIYPTYNILVWDVMGYNSYLPLIFKEHSFTSDLSYFAAINERYEYSSTLYQYADLPNGNVYIRYTMGWAILFTPFYLIADVWAALGGHLRDGFSFPYQVMSLIGAFFYFILNVLLIRKVLKLYFNEKVTTITLLIICLSSNFFFLSFSQIGITNNIIISVVAFFILQTHRFHENLTVKNAILLGMAVGMIALVRTPTVVVAIFAVIYGYKKYGTTVFQKIKYFLNNHLKLVLVAVFTAILVYAPQLIYWKITSGNFFINSYANNPGEGMDWFNPHILESLFSFKNGWLLYTPVMVFSILGFYFWMKEDKSTGLAGLITFLIFFYVISCWTTYWYANSFSNRAVIDAYALLAIPLAYFVKNVQKLWFYIAVGIFTILNFIQSYQANNWIINGNLMTREGYVSTFLQTSPITDYQRKLMDIDQITYSTIPLDLNEFNLLEEFNSPIDNFVLSTETQYAPGLEINLYDIKDKMHLMVRSTWSYAGDPKGLEGKILNTNMYYKGRAYWWRGASVVDSLIEHDSINKTITFNYIAPNLRSKKDMTYVGMWAQSGDSIIIKGLKVQVYEWDPLFRNRKAK